MSIDSSNKEYDFHVEEWQCIEASIKGKKELLEMGLTCPDYRETASNYSKVALRKKKYFERGRYFNAVGKTVNTLSGMVFEKDPEIDVPAQMDYIYTTAGSDGANISDIAQSVVAKLISVGRVGVFVDSPVNDAGQTIYEIESGINVPQITVYNAEQMFNWYSEGALQEVRLLETYSILDGLDRDFKTQIRRLVLVDGVYFNQVWRDYDLYSEVAPTSNGTTMDYIPFYFGGSTSNNTKIDKPPMRDLSEYNIGHFLLDCDNRENLHFHGQGMTNVYTDMSPEDFNSANPNGLDVGAKGVNQMREKDKIEILQIASTGALTEGMERDEKRMIMLGAQLIVDTNSNTTLGAKEMEFSSSVSTLKQVAHNASRLIQKSLQTINDMLGLSNDVVFKLNNDFVLDVTDATLVATHLQSVVQGVLPASTFYETARKAELTEKTDEEIEKDIADNAYIVPGQTLEQVEADLANEYY